MCPILRRNLRNVWYSISGISGSKENNRVKYYTVNSIFDWKLNRDYRNENITHTVVENPKNYSHTSKLPFYDICKDVYKSLFGEK